MHSIILDNMDENTIFQNPQIVQSQYSEENPNPQAPIPPQARPPLGKKPSFNFANLLKFILGFFVFLLVVFFIFNIVSNKVSKGGNKKVVLVYWGLWEDKPIMQSIISDFEKAYPNITVDYVKQDIKQYRERLVARIENGKGPDVFRFHNSWRSMLANYLLPLPSDTITKTDFENWFYPVVKKDLEKNRAIYGIPLGIDTLALFINNQLFQSAGLKAPTNWVDFANYARSLTVKDQSGEIITSGAAFGTFSNITHAPDIISLLFVQNGVDLYNISKTAKAASEALTFYTSFANSSSGTWDDVQDPSIMAFAKGNLAMYFGYSWDFFAIKALNPDLSFSIYPVPQLTNQNITIAFFWAEGVSAKSTHQKEAFLFMKFLARKETEQKLFSEESKTRLFGEPYARVDLAYLLKDNQYVYPFVLQANNATSSFFADGTFDNGLNTKTNSYLNNAVSSILSNTSPQSAVDTLSQGVSQVLNQYGQ